MMELFQVDPEHGPIKDNGMTLPGDAPRSGRFFSQGIPLHYLDWGNKDAPTLILLHGGGDHARSWDWTVARLRKHWRIIAVDLRGHGDSGRSPEGAYLMLYFVGDLALLTEHLGEQRLTIVAHSLGATIALRYAGLFPDKVRALVAIEGTGRVPDPTPAHERWRSWADELGRITQDQPRSYASLKDAETRLREANPALTEEQLHHLTEHGVRLGADGTYSWKFDNRFRIGLAVDMTADEVHQTWARITCPVLLMNGELSAYPNPATDGRLAHFRNARVSSFAKGSHWLHHDCFERFVSEAEDFLGEAPAGPVRGVAGGGTAT
jgi:pimeloyl-ACP methyl ester carboxylesterase